MRKILLILSPHTDSHSSNIFNLTLSKKRVKEVVDYIILKGINKSK